MKTISDDSQSLSNALHNPILLAQRTPVVLLDPQGHAAIVERVVTLTPHHHTIVLLVFVLTSQTGILRSMSVSCVLSIAAASRLLCCSCVGCVPS